MMENPNTLNSGMCRCCSSEGTFKDIKTKYHWMGEEEVYADMLTDCFDIKIQTPENMDNGICEVCITQLRNAANFKKQVLHTEEQFKKRLQNKDMKNPIKLESMEDSAGSDHLSDPDFSGNEYDIPIKEEVEEKPKAKKRSVKATTSRTKKPKNEPESSELHEPENERKTAGRFGLAEDGTPLIIPTEKNVVKKKSDYDTQIDNLQMIMRCSNATPFKFHRIWYSCCFCPEKFGDPAALKVHTTENHSNWRKGKFGRPLANLVMRIDITGLQCSLCRTAIDTLEQLIEHLREDHSEHLHEHPRNYIVPHKFGGKEIRCAVCSEQANNYSNLVRHMNAHYANFTCSECGAGFVNQTNLTLHCHRHEKGHYECQECQRVFATQLKLDTHLKFKHNGEKHRYRCNFCEETFFSYSVKNTHMVKEHKEEITPAECLECGKTFSDDKVLASHMKSYHSKKFTCPYCCKAFAFTRDLKQHLVTHTGERAFECPVCSKAYVRKSVLVEHMKIHAEDRTFTCEYCGRTFVNEISLKNHTRSQHGIDLE